MMSSAYAYIDVFYDCWAELRMIGYYHFFILLLSIYLYMVHVDLCDFCHPSLRKPFFYLCKQFGGNRLKGQSVEAIEFSNVESGEVMMIHFSSIAAMHATILMKGVDLLCFW